jgi:hypothetical protein
MWRKHYNTVRPHSALGYAHGVILSIRLVQNTGQVSQFGEEIL